MLLLGIDLGTSSVKVSVVDASTCACVASAQFPETEAGIISLHPGWAEQDPELWWDQVQLAILKCHSSKNYDPQDIAAIGIAYQMHGLVLVDKDQKVLRPSIIWCDSRAVQIGEQAFQTIGEKKCLQHLLNSPGNFTASKLAWVKQHETQLYQKIDKVLLPGDFIGMKLTGEITTTISALSEGVLWDFKFHRISTDIIDYFQFDKTFFPRVHPVFSEHGYLTRTIAQKLSLKEGIPVSYKAGDQLNNAFALHVMEPGEVAATAGTSGVIYGVRDQPDYDVASRLNSFAHINHTNDHPRIGVLLCINAAGICNRWIKNITGQALSYEIMNELAATIPAGAHGLSFIPFGNGAERMLRNQLIGAHFQNLDLNIHSTPHLLRAVQEGIVFAFRYGLDIMKENGINPDVIRAGYTNMFMSDVFTSSFVNTTGVSVQLFTGDGSTGAARGSGVGAGLMTQETASKMVQPVRLVEPSSKDTYEELYQTWKYQLEVHLHLLDEDI